MKKLVLPKDSFSDDSDGGYYAMKGFSFQLNATLDQILSTDEPVELEQTQDISGALTFTQVKYKEAARYYPSSIKKPICQLLQDSLFDTRKPKLFCFFRDEAERMTQLTRQQLDVILGDCIVGNTKYEFSDAQRDRFVDEFCLEFSPGFLSQLDGVVAKIRLVFSCDVDTARIFHSVMSQYLQDKVIQIPTASKVDRVCTKGELLSHVAGCEKSLFKRGQLNFLGKLRYFRGARLRYFAGSNLDYHERFFILDVVGVLTSHELLGLLLNVSKRFYRPYSRLIKSPAPYIYFHNIDPALLLQVKWLLVGANKQFRDGFCFEGSGFVLGNIIETCTLSNRIEVKLVNDASYLPKILSAIQTPKKIYHFHNGVKLAIDGGYDEYEILIEETRDIELVLA